MKRYIINSGQRVWGQDIPEYGDILAGGMVVVKTTYPDPTGFMTNASPCITAIGPYDPATAERVAKAVLSVQTENRPWVRAEVIKTAELAA